MSELRRSGSGEQQLGLALGSYDQCSAVLSDDGRHRYRLDRRWGTGAPVVFIMLNPSTADASVDDLYPGTGMVGRCWRVLSAEDLSDVSSAGGSDVSRVAVNDTSTPAPGDG